MPYNPTIIPNQTGLAPGLGAISGLVQDWQKKQEEQERLMGYNDAVVQHAAANGLISPDELNKYQAGDIKKKSGMAAGIMANLHFDLEQNKLEQQKQMGFAQLTNALEVARIRSSDGGGAPFKPQQMTLPPPADAPPGTPPIMVYSRGPNQVDPTPGQVASMKPAPGTPVYADDGSQIGVWNVAGNITKKTAEKAVDPQKQAMADILIDAMGGGKPTAPANDLKALAQKAIADPAATPEQKAAARKILGK